MMTKEELDAYTARAVAQAKKSLQTPPILQIEPDATEIISSDLGLKDFDDTKYVITDISYGIKDNKRIILVRNTNGVLETAPPHIRKRMNQTYFPRENREWTAPMLFSDDACLQEALDKQLYEYVLNRACIQYEPYEKDFHRITSLVYHHVNDTRSFEVLRSTRFFGSMAFYFAWHRTINNLLIDTLERGFFDNAVETIALMYNLNDIPYDRYVLELIKDANTEPEQKSAELERIRAIVQNAIGRDAKTLRADDACLKFIEQYLKQTKVGKKDELNTVFQARKREHAERQNMLQSLLKTHGIQESDA